MNISLKFITVFNKIDENILELKFNITCDSFWSEISEVVRHTNSRYTNCILLQVINSQT